MSGQETRPDTLAPRNWRPGIGPGVEFGLGAPPGPVVLGAPIPVEIHIRNVGSDPVEVPMRSHGTDESYPPCKFHIGRAAASLIPPGGLAAEAAVAPRKRTLQPNETLVCVVSLDTWVVRGDTSRNGTRVLDHPGVYWIECVWETTKVPPARAAAKLEFVRPGQPPEEAPGQRRLSRSNGSVPAVDRMPDYEVTYEHLAQMLQSADYRERYSAAAHLCSTCSGGWKGSKEEADQLVVTAMKDPYWAVRHEAAKFAACRGTLAAGAIPALIEALASEEPLVRNQCVVALGMAGGATAALPQLKRMLTTGDQLDAVAAVLLESPQGLQLLRDAADNPDAKVRLWSRAALARGGADAAPYVKELSTALKSGQKDAVIDACHSVELAGRAAGPAGTLLTRLLPQADVDFRRAASRALVEAAPQDQAVVDALVRGLADDDIRNECVLALGRIGPRGASAIPALVDLMAKGVAASQAMGALEAIDPKSPQALPVLIQLLRRSLEGQARPDEGAICAIGAYGPAGRAAVPELIRVLHVKGSHPYYIDKAIWALGQIGPDAVEARDEVRKFIPGVFAETARQALNRIEAVDPATMPPPETKYVGRTLNVNF